MNCAFCDEYKYPYNSLYYSKVGKKIGYDSRILLETANWYVIPTLGCLTIGYVLLVCKHHHLSLANINDDLFCEMLDLKNDVENVLYKTLGLHCLAFEHGTTNPLHIGANSVEHVHVHIVPFTKNAWSDISSNLRSPQFNEVKDYTELRCIWKKELPDTYLLFQDVDQTIYYANDASQMPSQLFRKCLIPLLGVDSWNWKHEYYCNNIIQTIALFKKEHNP